MTIVKLTDGTTINASEVVLENGVLKITTAEHTVEELAEIFSNKENTSMITLLTPARVVSGYKTGFTSFAGINYNPEGFKTVELFQPKDVTEARIANAEAAANFAKVTAVNAKETANSASMAAESANETANNANATAESASETANSANATAAHANDTANSAMESATALESSVIDTQLAVAELAELVVGGIE